MLLQTTQQWFEELGDTLDRLQGETEQSGITVAATTYVAARWLSAHVSAFNDSYPRVAVLLQHSVNSADFKLTDVDLAIRWGPCTGRHTRDRFGEMPMSLYPVISPQLLQKQGYSIHKTGTQIPATELTHGPLATLPLLSEDRHQDLWQEWHDSACGEDKQQHLPNPRRTIADSNVRVQAAIDGQGLILADQLMINELNSGQLLAPFAETLDGYGYALLCSPNRILNDNAQSLKNWLCTRSGL